MLLGVLILLSLVKKISHLLCIAVATCIASGSFKDWVAETKEAFMYVLLVVGISSNIPLSSKNDWNIFTPSK